MDMTYAENGQHRTLYSLRHTYATFELLNGRVNIHALAKQMGNSAAMIEKYYSKLTATMAARRLAWEFWFIDRLHKFFTETYNP